MMYDWGVLCTRVWSYRVFEHAKGGCFLPSSGLLSKAKPLGFLLRGTEEEWDWVEGEWQGTLL
jgi:hypothetical protein